MYIRTVVSPSIIIITISFSSLTTSSIPITKTSVSKTSFKMQFSKIIAIISLSATAYSSALPAVATKEPVSAGDCNASGTTTVACCSGSLLNLLCNVNILGSQCSGNGNAYCCPQNSAVRSSLSSSMF